MPTYQYSCTECGEQVEAVQKFTDEPLQICDACGGKLRKVFSPVGIVFKGSGFYRNDSRPGSKEKSLNGSSSSSDSKDSKDSKKDSGSGDSGSSSDSKKTEKPEKAGSASSSSSSSSSNGSSSSAPAGSSSSGSGSKVA